VDIQPVSGYAPHIAAPGAPGAPTHEDSITDLAQQHGVTRESLLEFVRSKIQQTRAANGESPVDRATLDRAIGHALDHGGQQPADGAAAAVREEPVPAGYTSTARSVQARPAVASSISVLA
jgi:transposase-like protein